MVLVLVSSVYNNVLLMVIFKVIFIMVKMLQAMYHFGMIDITPRIKLL